MADGRPILVRAYAAIHQHLPVARGGLFGRGLVVLSETGRGRFDVFPTVIADDLFLDGLFKASEKAICDDVVVRVQMPATTRELYARLVRVRRGNRELRLTTEPDGQAGGVAASNPVAWLRVVARRPWLAPAAVVYVALTLTADLAARRSGTAVWRVSPRDRLAKAQTPR